MTRSIWTACIGSDRGAISGPDRISLMPLSGALGRRLPSMTRVRSSTSPKGKRLLGPQTCLAADRFRTVVGRTFTS